MLIFQGVRGFWVLLQVFFQETNPTCHFLLKLEFLLFLYPPASLKKQDTSSLKLFECCRGIELSWGEDDCHAAFDQGGLGHSEFTAGKKHEAHVTWSFEVSGAGGREFSRQGWEQWKISVSSAILFGTRTLCGLGPIVCLFVCFVLFCFCFGLYLLHPFPPLNKTSTFSEF